MKISIITSCYNREVTIRDSIRSVMAQDYPDIEYIVVDGASTDKSLDIIKGEEEIIRGNGFTASHPMFTMKVISEPDSGMYEALNKGIRMATGEVIALLHSDDTLYDCHTISDVVSEMERTQCEFLYADGLLWTRRRRTRWCATGLEGDTGNGKCATDGYRCTLHAIYAVT